MSKEVTIPNRVHGESIAIGLTASDAGFQVANDGWFQVLKVGEFPHEESGTVQVVGEEDLFKIVNRFSKEAQGENFPGLLVDYDHFSMERSQSSAAAGWIDKVEVRNGGLWAHARWTSSGLQRIAGGEFRLVSPVLSEFVSEDESGEKTNRIRPGRLVSVALTNDPNIKGMVPVSHRRSGGSSNGNKPSARNRNSSMNYKDELCRLLGLNADATDEDIMGALEEMANKLRKNADGKAGEEMAKMDAENRRLRRDLDAQKDALKAVQNRRIEDTVKTYADVIPDTEEDRGKWKNRLAQNFDDAVSMLDEKRKDKATLAEKGGTKPRKEGSPPAAMHRNRQDGQHPGSADHGADTRNAAREKVSRKIKLRVAELMTANRGMSYVVADAKARLELAEEIEETAAAVGDE